MHGPGKTDAGPVAFEAAKDDPCCVVRFHQERHVKFVAIRYAAFDEAGTDNGYADTVLMKLSTQRLTIDLDGRLAGGISGCRGHAAKTGQRTDDGDLSAAALFHEGDRRQYGIEHAGQVDREDFTNLT